MRQAILMLKSENTSIIFRMIELYYFLFETEMFNKLLFLQFSYHLKKWGIPLKNKKVWWDIIKNISNKNPLRKSLMNKEAQI